MRFSRHAYSTAPTELAQRVSTVASATEAMDLMASISALIPTASVGINAAGEMRRVASGQVDAVESAPLIVGFSNNGAANKAAQQVLAYGEEPSFGWVFGPKVIVNTEDSELELSQVLVNQPVTADVSVPGWWTEMRLRIETAWAANFDKALLQPANKDGTPLKTEEISSYSIDVPLQSNPESFEQLTQFIASKAWGLQQHEPVIIDVEPKAIAACSRVTVLISGPDLWRGRAVYLAGTPAENTEIMPDMRGLAATFVLPRSAIGTANLVVWTQLGKVESPVTVKASANCGTDGNSGTGLAEATVEPTVAWLGSKLAIRAGGSWPDAGGVFSGFISPNGNQAQITAIPTENIAFSDPILEATLPDAVEGNKLVEGTAFSGAIQYAAGQDKTTIAQFGPFNLYSSEDEASIRIASAAGTVSQKDLRERGVVLTITLPKNLAKAYRSLMDDGLELALADEDGKIVGRRTDFTFPTDDSTTRQVKYRLKLNAKPILGDADGTLKVTVVVGDKTTPPQFPHVTVASLVVTKE